VNFPLAAPLPISPIKYKKKPIELYSKDWRFILPCFISDIKRGLLWDLQMNLDYICLSLGDKVKLVDFLLRRTNSKTILMEVLRAVVEQGEELSVIAAIFDKLNNVLAAHEEKQKKQKSSTPVLEPTATAQPLVEKRVNIDPAGRPEQNKSDSLAAKKIVTFWNQFINSSNNEEIHDNQVVENKAMELSDVKVDNDTNTPKNITIATVTEKSESSLSNSQHPEQKLALGTTLELKKNSPAEANIPELLKTDSVSEIVRNKPANIASHIKPSTNEPNATTNITLNNNPPDSPEFPNKNGNPDSPSNKGAANFANVNAIRSAEGYIVIEQEEMYAHVFMPVEESGKKDPKYMVAVLTEYIRSLNFKKITVHSFLYELLIDLLVRNNRFYQLHQFLQYHVISDSMHVACQLLSLETFYPPAYQLALDMLKRLSANHTKVYDHIVDILVIKGQLLQAMRFIKSHKLDVQPHRFLEAADKSNDDKLLFYMVYNFFNRRKQIDASCEQYSKIYKEKFTDNDTNLITTK